MMRKFASLAAGAVLAALAAMPASAQEAPKPPHQEWSWDGIFGTYDLASVQRGFQVYSEVCANCHSMHSLHYRDLGGIGLKPDEVKAIAASVEVPQGLDDQGNPKTGPGTPASQFRSPFANDIAARAANNGALPPDLSLIVKARDGGADYVYSILNGFKEPPAGFKVSPGMHYNIAFPGHQIAMPPPLSEGAVEYPDKTKATVPQMAHDVATFLAWAAEPTMEVRKRTGVKVILFLLVLTGMLYAVKRKVWADVH